MANRRKLNSCEMPAPVMAEFDDFRIDVGCLEVDQWQIKFKFYIVELFERMIDFYQHDVIADVADDCADGFRHHDLVLNQADRTGKTDFHAFAMADFLTRRFEI